MEGVISPMIAAGPDSNRPPHILFELMVSRRETEMNRKTDQPGLVAVLAGVLYGTGRACPRGARHAQADGG